VAPPRPWAEEHARRPSYGGAHRDEDENRTT
jgi:hypothetical protein